MIIGGDGDGEGWGKTCGAGDNCMGNGDGMGLSDFIPVSTSMQK